MTVFPDKPLIGFAHVAYRFGERFQRRGTGLPFVTFASLEALADGLGEIDVLVVSGLWRNELAAKAPRLCFIQSISAGTDQYDRALLAARGIRLASAQGANARAVSDHAMALILALWRRIPEACANQQKRHWRGMIGDLAMREDELGGKTLLVVGLGRIGGRLARLAKAFGMTVLGVRGNPAAGTEGADEVHGLAALPSLLARADVVALTCPLTPETTGLFGREAFARLRPGAVLVNVARGKVVDTEAMLAALSSGRLGGAALDVTDPEPLPPESPLWAMPNVLITPHTGGETRCFEDNVIDLLLDNLGRLGRGETTLRNQIV